MNACTQLRRVATETDGLFEIDPTDLPREASLRIVDVREPAEFVDELGHIPRAELVPLGTIAGAATTWSKETPIVVVCRSGRRSAMAARLLTQLGFRCVINLRGGMLAYARTRT